ncbi:MAG: hypothetical protein ABSH19_08905, partial [Opitutales bacterium]
MKTSLFLPRLRSARGVCFLAAILLGLLPYAGVAQLFLPNGTTIGTYNPNTGAPVNATLITVPDGGQPSGVAVSGSSLYLIDTSSASVSVYNAITGALVNSSLMSGILFPSNIVVSGGNLYVSNGIVGTSIGLYTTAGVAINPILITRLPAASSFTVSGSSLYVSDFNNGTISEYDSGTGALINATLVSGLDSPNGLAVANGELFVANFGNNTIGCYNATTGAAINATLISGLAEPSALAIANGQLFVSSFLGNVGSYDPATGAAINADLVSGLTGSFFLAVSPVGEPIFAIQPANTTVTLGQPVTFTSEAVGSPAPTSQWQISTDSGVTWTNLTDNATYSGSATANLTITTTSAGQLGDQFRVLATNSADTAASFPATLGLNFPPTITSIPGNTFVTRGTIVTFTAGVSGTPPFSYQWQLNGRNIRLANGASYTTPKNLGSTPNTYDVIVTNPYGSVTSQSFIFQSLIAPVINKQPLPTTARSGGTATFVVTAS